MRSGETPKPRATPSNRSRGRTGRPQRAAGAGPTELTLGPGVAIASVDSDRPADSNYLTVAQVYAGSRNAIGYLHVNSDSRLRISPVPPDRVAVGITVCSGPVTVSSGAQRRHEPTDLIFTAGPDAVTYLTEQFSWIATIRVNRDDLNLTDAEVQSALDGQLVWAKWHREMLLNVAKTIPTSIGDPAHHADPDGVDHYLAATLELLVRSALGAASGLRNARLAPGERRLAAEQFIRRHLLDPELGPDMVAEHLGVSKRQLARAFTRPPGVAATIAIERLTRADHLLRDRRRAGMTITEIAQHCQFSSSARFSKAYKSHFGITPREARAGVVGSNLDDSRA